MDIYQIRYFLAVAETGSFTGAAQRVFVTQPTLSAGIRKLEDGLGARLFDRSARKVQLTVDGERFMPRARAILREVRAAEADLSTAHPTSRLRIGILTTLRFDTIAAMLGAFCRANPTLDLELVQATVAEIDERLRQDRLDVAITIRRPQSQRRGFRRLYSERLGMALPADHALARRPAFRPEDLHERPLIVRTHDEFLTAARRELVRRGIRPRIVFRTQHDERALALVGAGLGFCLMPMSFQAPGVAMLPVDGVNLQRLVGIAYDADNEQDDVMALADHAANWRWHGGPSDHRLVFAH